MHPWTADIMIDERLVRRLVQRFPSTADASVRLLAEGWDRSIWLAGEEWAFGFPRRAAVAAGLETEIAFLPRLAPLLPASIPVPSLVGKPTPEFGWPFFGSVLIPGTEFAQADLEATSLDVVAADVGRFLRTLHSSDVAKAVGADALPVDPNRRADMGDRVAKARAQLADCAAAGIWTAPPAVTQLLDEAERLGPSTARHAVVHGDLHMRHILVDAGRLSGVIDWIDLCRADPAVDLSLLWSGFGPGSRRVLLREYGSVSDDQLIRARVLALSLCAALALYAEAVEHDSLRAAAAAGLARTMRDL